MHEGRRTTKGVVGGRVWYLPTSEQLKVNINAAIFLDGTVGVGAVIRDDHDCFFGARGRKITSALTPREAEAIGLKEALSQVIDRGYTHCVFETDSGTLVDACNESQGRALFELLLWTVFT